MFDLNTSRTVDVLSTQVSLFIGRLHPSVEYGELRSALARLLAEVKEAEAEVEQRQSRRHHSHRHRHRDRSPWQRESNSDGATSLWPLVRVVKHPITGTSRGYAFAWFKSSRDARRVLDTWRASSSLFTLGGGVKVDLARIFGDLPCWEQVDTHLLISHFQSSFFCRASLRFASSYFFCGLLVSH